jgi:hypothetical protein
MRNSSPCFAVLVLVAAALLHICVAQQQYGVSITSVSNTAPVYGEAVLVRARVTSSSNTALSGALPTAGKTILIADDTGVSCNAIIQADGSASCALGFLPVGRRTITAVLDPCDADIYPQVITYVTVQEVVTRFTNIVTTPSPAGFQSVTVNFCLTTNSVALAGLVAGNVTVSYGPQSVSVVALTPNVALSQACGSAVVTIPDPGSFSIELAYTPVVNSFFPPVYTIYQQAMDLGLVATININTTTTIVAKTPLVLKFDFFVQATKSNREVRGHFQVAQGSEIGCTVESRDGRGSCVATFNKLTTELRRFDVIVVGDDEVHYVPPKALALPVAWVANTFVPTLPYLETFDADSTNSNGNGYWYPFDLSGVTSVGGSYLFERSPPNNTFIRSTSPAWWTPLSLPAPTSASAVNVTLYSPVFDLTGVAGGTPIVFGADVWFQVERNADFIYVERRIGAGAWTLVGDASLDINWYTSAVGGWTGDTSEYVSVYKELVGAAGNLVQVRITYIRNAGNIVQDGVSIDNVRLIGQNVGVPRLVVESGPAVAGTPIQVRVASATSASVSGTVSVTSTDSGTCSATISAGSGNCVINFGSAGVKTLTLVLSAAGFATQPATATATYGALATMTLAAQSEVYDDFETAVSVTQPMLYWYAGRSTVFDAAFEIGAPNSLYFDHSFSGSNAWVTNLNGPAPQEINGAFDVRTGRISLLGVTSGSLYLGASIWFESSPSQASAFEYSTDGTTWTQVGPSAGDFGNTYTSASGWQGSSIFQKNGKTWQQVYMPLPAALLNSQFQLRLNYKLSATAENTLVDGIAFDDFQLIAGLAPTTIKHTVPVYAVSGVNKPVTIQTSSINGTQVSGGTITVSLHRPATGVTFATTCTAVSATNAACSVTLTSTADATVTLAVVYTPSAGYASSRTYVVVDVRTAAVTLGRAAGQGLYVEDFTTTTATNPSSWRTSGRPVWSLTDRATGPVTSKKVWSTNAPGAALRPVYFDAAVLSPVFDYSALANEGTMRMLMNYTNLFADGAAWLEISQDGGDFVPFGSSSSSFSITSVSTIPVWNSTPYVQGAVSLYVSGGSFQLRVRADGRTSNLVQAAFGSVALQVITIDVAFVSTYGFENPHNATALLSIPVSVSDLYSYVVGGGSFATYPATMNITQGNNVLGVSSVTASTTMPTPITVTFNENRLSGVPVMYTLGSSMLYTTPARPLPNIETAFPVVSTFPYTDNFDGSTSLYAALPPRPESIWTRGTPPVVLTSSGSAWYTRYNTSNLAGQRSNDFVLTSPVFNVTVGGGIFFFHSFNLDAQLAGSDVFGVTYRTSNNGINWVTASETQYTGRQSGTLVSLRVPPTATYVQFGYRVRFSTPGTYVVLDNAYAGYLASTAITITGANTVVPSSSVPVLYTFTVQSNSSTPSGTLTVTAAGNSACVRNTTMSPPIACNITLSAVGRTVITASYQPDNVNTSMAAVQSFVVDVLASVSPTQFPYLDTFESANVWTANTAGWQLQTPNGPTINRAFSPTKAWYLQGPSVVSAGEQLTSPVFDLSKAYANATKVYAGMQLWVRLSSPTAFTITGLAGQTFTSTPPIAYQDEYRQYWVQLPGGANQTAMRMTVTGAIAADEGVAIDDFQLTTKVPTSISATGPANVQLGQTVTMTFQVLEYFTPVVAPVAGTVTVSVTGDTCTTTVDANGRGRCDIDLTMQSTGATLVSLVYTPTDAVHHPSTATVRIVVHPTVNLNANDLPYFDDFEGGSTRLIGQWIAGDPLWQLGSPVPSAKEYIKSAASGTKAWVTGLDRLAPRNADASLYSTVFDLTSIVAATPIYVGFKLQCSTQPVNAYVGLQARYDDEQDWNTIGKAGDYVNWYYSNNNGWDGSQYQDRYYPAVHIVPRAARNFVQFRLRYMATGAYERDGFAMDDFVLAAGYPLEIKPVSVVPNVLIAGTTAQVTYQITAPSTRVSAYAALNGVLTIGLDSGEQCTATIVLNTNTNTSGIASCALTFDSPGDRIINVEFCGPAPYNLTTVTFVQPVLRAVPTIVVTAIGPDTTPVIAGLAALVRFRVQSNTVTRVPTGSVVVSDASGSSCSSTLLADGSGSCTLVFPVAGERTLALAYSGDDLHALASSFIVHTVLAVIDVTNTNLPLADSFDGSASTWVTDTWRPATRKEWVLGTPNGVFINRAASGAKAWYTALAEPAYLGTSQFVYSSVYNVSSVRFGTDIMFSANIWWNMGANNLAWIESRVDQGAWSILGSFDEETYWYNRASPAGWSGTELRTYREAFHQLISTSGAKLVQMRFVLRRTADRRREDGFAFDDATVRLTAPVVLEFDPAVFPIAFGTTTNVTVRTASAFYNNPAGTFAVSLGDGQSCNGPSDNAGEIRCQFAFTQQNSRSIAATFTSSQLVSAMASRSTVLPVQSTILLTNTTAQSYRNNFETSLTADDWFTDNPKVWQQTSSSSSASALFGTTSGTGSWVATFSDDDLPSATASLISPRFNLSQVDSSIRNFQISMQLNYNLDSGDQLFIDKRTSGAWVTVDSLSTRTLINWYSGTTGFVGSSNGYQDVHFRVGLNNTNTQRTIQFRLRLVSTSNNLYSRGVAFDDFQISSLNPVQIIPSVAGLVALGQAALVSAAAFSPMGPSGGANSSIIRIYEGKDTVPLCTVARNVACNITLSGAARITVLRFEAQVNNTLMYSNYPVFSRPFPVSNLVSIANNMAYTDDFESASNPTWLPDQFYWTKGSPQGALIRGVTSGTNAWYTNRRTAVRINDAATLYSPVFDLTNNNDTSYVLGLKAWWDVVCNGGAEILIATAPLNSPAAANFVALSYNSTTALNWYNTACMGASHPSWSNPAPTAYVPAYASLGGAANSITGRRVQFAVRLTVVNNVEQDGFAFDDFAFGNGQTLATSLKVDNIFPANPLVGRAATFWWSVHELFGMSRVYGGTVTVTSSLAGEGTVCQRAVNVYSGVGQCSATFSSTGARTLTFTYTPNDSIHQVAHTTVAVNVVAADPTIVFRSVAPAPSSVGSTVVVKLLVQPSFSASSDGKAAAGVVTIADSTSPATCTATLVSGAATCAITFTTAGTRTLTASYTKAGATSVTSTATISHEVRQSTTTVSSIFPSSVKIGVPVTVSFTVSSNAVGSTVQGQALVTTSLEGARCYATVFAGVGSCVLPALNIAGDHTITVTFYGAGELLPPSVGTSTLRVDPALATFLTIGVSPSVIVISNGASVSATVRVNDGTRPTGTVLFTMDGAVLCPAAAFGYTGTLGVASCAIPAQYATGTHTLVASYPVPGSSALPSSTDSGTLTVIAPTMQLTAVSTPNPSYAANLTITVSGTITTDSGKPLGGVLRVSDSRSNERCAPSNAQYRAGGAFSCTLKISSLGSHNITVRYEGDLVNPPAVYSFLHSVLLAPPGQTSPVQVPPVVPWRENENGPTIAQALLLSNPARGHVVLRNSSTTKRSFVENNMFRLVVAKALDMQLYHIGVDDAALNEFDFVLAADNGRSGALLIRSLIILVEVNDPDIRGTMLEGATITLYDTPPPPQPSPPPIHSSSYIVFEPPKDPQPTKVEYYYYGPPVVVDSASTLSTCAALFITLMVAVLALL